MTNKKKPANTDAAAEKDIEKATDGTTAEPVKSLARKQDGGRETFESIIVAFVLAFLFRAFEAEAFVIPTGSMAPTLFGRHKEADCSACGFHFAFGASDEVDDERGLLLRRIQSAVCPNCRFENSVRDLPVFTGDRILVNKFPYELGKPDRWDVPVFKYPERPTTNYIKRLVGLPNETIIIRRGDLYREEADRTQSILRKPPEKQKVLQIPVYDLNHPETLLREKGWPHRWAAVEQNSTSERPRKPGEHGPIAGWSETTSGWQEDSATHSFQLDQSQANEERWVRYRHFVPGSDDWSAATGSGLMPANRDDFFSEPGAPKARLISDFCGYNSYSGGNGGGMTDDIYWVGDLTLSGNIEVLQTDKQSQLVLELCEGIRTYRVRIDVSSGKARLLSLLHLADDEGSENDAEELGAAQTPVSGTGSWSFRFANVDDRLCLWVDDTLIDFGPKAAYSIDASFNPSPRASDLTPVGIAASGMSVRVSNLLIERDIYYRAKQADNDADERGGWHEEEYPNESELRSAQTDPDKWNRLYSERSREAKFTLGDDEYLMLGDNSPRSQDSRIWPNTRGAERRHTVPGSALVGRAFYVYWPHGVPFMNGGKGYALTYHREIGENGQRAKTDYPGFSIPFYPNIARMKRIR